jgi:TonB family protein
MEFTRMKTIVFLLLAAGLAFAQNRPDARDLLSRADAPIFTAKTVRLAATRATGAVGAAPIPASPFKIEFVRGGKSRVEYLSGNFPISLTIFDGTDLWEYHQLGNQYTKTSAHSWVPSEIETLDYGRGSANILSASYEKDETIEFRGGRVDCYIILATYRRAPGISGSSDSVRRVWVAKESELILRDYWEGAGDRGGANRTVTTNFTNIETDVTLSDDRFVFQPPPESKMGPPLTIAGMIGGAPAAGTLQTKVEPYYSTEARAAGLQGSVILEIEITRDGHTRNPRLMHSLGLGLDEEAAAAVKQWRYAPYASGPVVHRVVEVPFRLQPAAPWVLDASEFRAQAPNRIGNSTAPEMRQYAAPEPAACSTQGHIAVNFDIDSKGAPSDIRVAAGVPAAARDAVLAAIQSWRFQPATSDGSASPGVARVLLECHPPQPEAPASSPIYSAGAVAHPELIFKVEPEYSEQARQAKIDGQVALSLVVDADGRVSDVRVVRPFGMGLDEQAIAAVMQWRFKPGMKDGKPVRVTAQVTVDFRLL